MQVARLSPATVRFVALPWRQRGCDGDAVTMLMACGGDDMLPWAYRRMTWSGRYRI